MIIGQLISNFKTKSNQAPCLSRCSNEFEIFIWKELWKKKKNVHSYDEAHNSIFIQGEKKCILLVVQLYEDLTMGSKG